MEADEEVMEEGDRVNQAEVGQLYLSNNATGYLGVYRDGDRFQAKFMRGGKTTYLGHFGTAVEAAVAYLTSDTCSCMASATASWRLVRDQQVDPRGPPRKHAVMVAERKFSDSPRPNWIVDSVLLLDSKLPLAHTCRKKYYRRNRSSTFDTSFTKNAASSLLPSAQPLRPPGCGCTGATVPLARPPHLLVPGSPSNQQS